MLILKLHILNQGPGGRTGTLVFPSFQVQDGLGSENQCLRLSVLYMSPRQCLDHGVLLNLYLEVASPYTAP